MTIQEKRLAQFTPDTQERTYYTVPAGTSTILTNVLVANSAATSTSLSMSLVIVGGAPGTANRIIPGIMIPANTVVPFDLSSVMAAGDFLTALAGAANVISVYVSGTERASADATTVGMVTRGTRKYRLTLYARSNFR